MDFSGLQKLNLTQPPKDVRLYLANGDFTGLTVRLLPTTAKAYQKVLQRIEDASINARARNKQVPKAQMDELKRDLFASRIDSWTIEEPWLSVVGDAPCNKRNVIALFFDQGEDSVALRNQIDEASRFMAEDFADE